MCLKWGERGGYLLGLIDNQIANCQTFLISAENAQKSYETHYRVGGFIFLTKLKKHRKTVKFLLPPIGSLSPGSVHASPSAQPPSTLAEKID